MCNVARFLQSRLQGKFFYGRLTSCHVNRKFSVNYSKFLMFRMLDFTETQSISQNIFSEV